MRVTPDLRVNECGCRHFQMKMAMCLNFEADYCFVLVDLKSIMAQTQYS